MATSINVNLDITSAVGIRRPELGVRAPRPIMTTTFTLNGESFPDPDLGETKVLEVNQLTDFIFYPGSTSSAQTVYITNKGNTTVTMVTPFFKRSTNGAEPVFGGPIVDQLQSLTIPQIAPNSTGTFTVAYTGQESGEFTNWILILTDADQPQYKIVTRQIVSDEFTSKITPLSYTTTTNSIGERAYVSYVITPIINDVERPDLALDYSYTLTEGTGWKVLSTSTNVVTLEFESNDVNNRNGTYQAILSLSAANATVNLPTTAIVNIDFEKNYNLLQWMSPIAYHNSVIGISYDVIDGEKTLTIAVGTGGDGSPDYDAGGEIYLDMRNIGIGGDNMDNPYIYWAEAYRFRNLGTGTAKTYLSGTKNADGVYLYQEKFTEERNYSYYFGSERSFGSMFIVQDDGLGNITVTLNNLREYSEDEEFNVTLDNLTRAFHYYSEKDIGERIVNLVQYPIVGALIPPTEPNTTSTVTPPGETRTNLFRGINYVIKSPIKRAAATASAGATSLTLDNVIGLVQGDIIRYIGTLTVEGRVIEVNGITSSTGVISLSTSLPVTVTSGTSITFKNPVTVATTLVSFPK